MSRVLLGLALPLCAATLLAQEPSRLQRPRLVVLCSIDQLASWVFAAARPHLVPDGGFARLLDEGVHFAECAYEHACTETGPGHATLGTGAPARLHGIVKNEWFDRATGKKAYCVGDPAAAALDGFAEGAGKGPGRLLLPTVGDLLADCDPEARIVSVSHKDRSAILMAGSKASAVVWFEAATGRFVTNATWGAAPQWLLELDALRPADRWFGWTWERTGPDSAYEGLVDDRSYEAPHASSGKRTLPCTITGGRHDEPTKAFYTEAYVSPISNELVLQAALAAITGEGLGQDGHADLLCLSFSANDTVGHYFGPDSVEARDMLLRTDALLLRLFAALDEQVGRGAYAFVLTADHGVSLPPEAAKEQGKGGGRALMHTQCKAAAEAALAREFGPAGDGPYVVHAGEYSLVLDRARILAQRGSAASAAPAGSDPFAAACAVAATACEGVRGVLAAHPAQRVADAIEDQDPIVRALAQAYHERSGDVMFVPQEHWLEPTLPASHGTPHPYDTRVPLLAMGPMLRKGRESGAACSPGLAAALCAWWLGVELPAPSAQAVPEDALVR